jgi:alpha-1,3-fucosyltransferase 10
MPITNLLKGTENNEINSSLHSSILGEEMYDDEFFTNKNISEPIVIWWTPFTLDLGSFRKCSGDNKCFFTNMRRFKLNNRTSRKAFMFYGTDFRLYDLPLPRHAANEDWALLHEESPKNNYLLSFGNVMRLFNHTSTFKRQSHYPLLTQFLTSLNDLVDDKYLVATSEKNRLQIEADLAPIAYIQSDCTTASHRDDYVKALMKYIRVDSYGKCLQNKQLPANLSHAVTSMNDEEFYKIVAKYKFVLAMENAVCDDYVTEKLWRPYYVGSVPIVYGSPKIRDILPDNRSAILVDEFNGAKALANFIHELNKNDAEYEKYLDYKRTKLVRNELLVRMMKQRDWHVLTGSGSSARGNLIDGFECFVCDRLHENVAAAVDGQKQRPLKSSFQADKSHYGCPAPSRFDDEGRLIDPSKPDQENYFRYSYELANCEQKIFFDDYLSKNNFNFTAKDLKAKSFEMHRNLSRLKSNHDDLRTDLKK